MIYCEVMYRTINRSLLIIYGVLSTQFNHSKTVLKHPSVAIINRKLKLYAYVQCMQKIYAVYNC